MLAILNWNENFITFWSNYLHGSSITQKQSHKKLMLFLNYRKYNRCKHTQIPWLTRKSTLMIIDWWKFDNSRTRRRREKGRENLLASSRKENHYAEESRGQRGRETWDLGLVLTWFRRRWREKRRSRRRRTTTAIRWVRFPGRRVGPESETESPWTRSPRSSSSFFFLLLLARFFSFLLLCNSRSTHSTLMTRGGVWRLFVWMRGTSFTWPLLWTAMMLPSHSWSILAVPSRIIIIYPLLIICTKTNINFDIFLYIYII